MKYVSALLVILLFHAMVLGGVTREKGLCGSACCKTGVVRCSGAPSGHALSSDAGRYPLSKNEASLEQQDADPAGVPCKGVRYRCAVKEEFMPMPPRPISSTLASIRTVTLLI